VASVARDQHEGAVEKLSVVRVVGQALEHEFRRHREIALIAREKPGQIGAIGGAAEGRRVAADLPLGRGEKHSCRRSLLAARPRILGAGGQGER
jgi:hypothetical protein